MSRDERSKPVLCISFDFWYYLYCMESYKKNHVCDVINLILYSNFVFTICVKYWEDSWKTIISDLHKTIFINYPISAQKFIFQIFCWNFRQRCLLGSLRAELYWIFYITVFSYFFCLRLHVLESTRGLYPLVHRKSSKFSFFTCYWHISYIRKP
jgi:hypothetical protein